MQHLVIQLLRRQVSVIDGTTGKPVDDGHGVVVSYDTVQHGVERGLLRAMSAIGLPHLDVVHATLAEAFKTHIAASAVRLTLRGPEREIAVAALHLRLRFGLTLLSPGAPWSPGSIEVEHIRGASDFYEAFDIDVGVGKLKTFAEVVHQWSKMDVPPSRARAAQGESLLRKLEIGTPARPLTIVVTGATGKGKSTFVNALLRRQVLPQSGEGVCTAVNIKLIYAEQREAEGLRVHWRPDLESRRLKLTAEKKQLESKRTRLKVKVKETARQVAQDIAGNGADAVVDEEEGARLRRLAEVDRLLDACAQAEELKKSSSRRALSELARFAQVSGGLETFVDHVEAFLHHPLLRMVNLVDAPGLRDKDEERGRSALRAFVGDSAWLYLHRLSDREATWTEDVEKIHSWANNFSGVLVLTCADQGQPDPGRSLQEMAAGALLSKNHSAFAGEKEWCAALPVLSLLRGLGSRTERERVRLAVGRLLGCEDEDCWIDGFDEELKGSGTTTLVDYVYDASRLPACIQRAVQALLRYAVESRLRDVGRELHAEVDDAIALVEEAIAIEKDALEALASIEKMSAHIESLERRSESHRGSLSKARAASTKIIDSIGENHRACRVDFDGAAEELSTKLDAKVESLMKAETKNRLWATFEVPVFKFYAVPLAKKARSILEEARGETAALVRIPPDELIADLFNKILADDAFSGDTFEGQERWREWHDDALQRTVSKARVRAEIERNAIREGFCKELSRMEAAARQLRGKVADEWEHRIEADTHQIKATLRDIEQRDPGKSRLVYEANIADAERSLSALRAFASLVASKLAPGPDENRAKKHQ